MRISSESGATLRDQRRGSKILFYRAPKERPGPSDRKKRPAIFPAGEVLSPCPCFRNHAAQFGFQRFPMKCTSYIIRCQKKFAQTNREVTDLSMCVRRMASPIRWATDRTLIFLHFSASALSGMELVTINSSRGDSLIFRIAGPESTG